MSKPSSLEHHQQGDQEVCIVRLLFRCDICHKVYASMEGILSHLDVHEITAGSKELHYQEINANENFYQCRFCTDHRAYSEIHYRNHLHDVHDDYDGNVCSERLKNIHATSYCKAGDLSSSGGLKVERNHRTSSESVNQLADGQNQESQEQSQSTIKESLIILSITVDSEDEDTDMDENSEGQVPAESISEAFSESSIKWPCSCDICGYTLTSYSQAEQHKMARHGIAGKCPYCSRIFQVNRNFRFHVVSCEGRKYSCDLCGRKFKSVRGATRHKLRAHKERKHVCEFCGRTFKNARGVTWHKLRAHKHEEASNVAEINSVDSSADCRGDSSVSNLVTSDISHSVSTTENSSVDRNASKARTLHPYEKSVPEFPNTKCSHCMKEFRTEAFLRRHYEQCHVPGMCDICGISFENTGRVRYHKIRMHQEPKLRCPRCPKTFDKKKRYLKHLSVCEEREFSCDKCDQKFKKLNYVRRHTVLYHQGKPVPEKVKKNTSKKVSVETSERVLENASKKALEDNDGHSSNESHGRNSAKRNQKTTDEATELESSEQLVKTACPICGGTFRTQLVLIQHVRKEHQLDICITCRIIFSGADEFLNHKRTCPEPPTDHQLGNKSTVTNVAIDEIVDLEMEIKVEDSMLQELEHRASDGDREKSGQSIIYKKPVDTSKHVAPEGAYHDDKIQIKQEYVEGEEES